MEKRRRRGGGQPCTPAPASRREARRGRQPHPAQPQGEQVPQREPWCWATTRASPPPCLPLRPGLTPASPSAQLCLANCNIRFVATSSDISPRLGRRGRRLSETGRLTERGNRAGAAVRAPQSHKYPPSSEWELGSHLAPEAGVDPSVPPRGERRVSAGAHAGDLSCVVFRKLPRISLPLSLLSVHFPAWTHPANK